MSVWLFQILLGIVQGLTEFLPVSSSGHLALANAVAAANGLILPETTLVMEVGLHLATVLAVIFVFRRDFGRMIASIFKPGVSSGGYLSRLWSGEYGRLLILTLAATIPAAVLGVALGKRIEAVFDEPRYISLFLIATGLILLLTHFVAKGRKGILEIGIWVALAVGCAQAVALLPGISRSGATICMALLLGIVGKDAARFSLIMSVPAVLGTSALKLLELLKGDIAISWGMGLGFVAALVVGYLAIHWLVAVVSRRKLIWFACYCLLAGGGFTVWAWNYYW